MDEIGRQNGNLAVRVNVLIDDSVLRTPHTRTHMHTHMPRCSSRRWSSCHRCFFFSIDATLAEKYSRQTCSSPPSIPSFSTLFLLTCVQHSDDDSAVGVRCAVCGVRCARYLVTWVVAIKPKGGLCSLFGRDGCRCRLLRHWCMRPLRSKLPAGMHRPRGNGDCSWDPFDAAGRGTFDLDPEPAPFQRPVRME